MFARTSILVLSAPLLVGCHSIDVSKLEPFDNYVGCSVLLQRPMALVRESRGMMSRSHLPRLRTSPYVMLDIQESEKSFLHLYPTDTNVTVLPTGHSVTIRTVRNEIAFVDPVYTTVYGELILPGGKRSVRFAYAWGDTLRLFPAPWEPDSVPRRRYRLGHIPDPLFERDLRGVVETDIPRWGRKLGRN